MQKTEADSSGKAAIKDDVEKLQPLGRSTLTVYVRHRHEESYRQEGRGLALARQNPTPSESRCTGTDAHLQTTSLRADVAEEMAGLTKWRDEEQQRQSAGATETEVSIRTLQESSHNVSKRTSAWKAA